MNDNFELGQIVQYIVDGRRTNTVEVLTVPSLRHADERVSFMGRILTSADFPDSIGGEHEFSLWNFYPVYREEVIIPKHLISKTRRGMVLRREYQTERGVRYFTVRVTWVNPESDQFHGKVIDSTMLQVARPDEYQYFNMLGFQQITAEEV